MGKTPDGSLVIPYTNENQPKILKWRTTLSFTSCQVYGLTPQRDSCRHHIRPLILYELAVFLSPLSLQVTTKITTLYLNY